MEDKKKKKTRSDIVKNCLIAFLSVMLVLTFFSNTIMNYSLPEVSAAYVYSGSVTSKVRGSGTVEAAEDYEVKVDKNHIVNSVKVKVGDTVEADQVLFELASSGDADEETLKEAKETLDALELEYNKALLTVSPNYAIDNLEINAAKEELDAALIEQSKAAGRDSLVAQQVSAQAYVDTLTTEIEQLETEKSTATEETIAAIEEALTAKNQELEEAKRNLAGITAQLEGTMTKADADALVREKSKALETLRLSLAEKQANDQVAQGQAALDLAAMKKKVDDQRELVKELEDGAGKTIEIKAKNAGVIRSVNCIAGDTVTPDMALASIAVTGNGYSLQFTVTEEQSKLVRKGQTAEILNVWGTDLSAELSAIKPDLDNPNKNKVLVFNITGEDVVVGQTLELSVGEKSAPYEVVVPNSSIHEDNKGHFVLAVTAKNSPLGNRYVVSRMDIEVLATDDTNSAVSGAFVGNEYVVTNSSAPLEPGMKVRLTNQ